MRSRSVQQFIWYWQYGLRFISFRLPVLSLSHSSVVCVCAYFFNVLINHLLCDTRHTWANVFVWYGTEYNWAVLLVACLFFYSFGIQLYRNIYDQTEYIAFTRSLIKQLGKNVPNIPDNEFVVCSCLRTILHENENQCTLNNGPNRWECV